MNILMIDIETLGVGPDAVAWQTALYAIDSTDPDTLLDLPHFQYLPIQPQLDLIPQRKIDASTMLFWMGEAAKNPQVIEDIRHCDSSDFDELPSLMRHFLRAFDRYTLGGKGDYELWTRGNFDLPILQSLLRQCGFDVPWDYRKTRDLRTLEAISGVSYKDVAQPEGFIKHRADWDAKFQILHWAACQRALGTAKAG